jgi:hypothetical protein
MLRLALLVPINVLFEELQQYQPRHHMHMWGLLVGARADTADTGAGPPDTAGTSSCQVQRRVSAAGFQWLLQGHLRVPARMWYVQHILARGRNDVHLR